MACSHQLDIAYIAAALSHLSNSGRCRKCPVPSWSRQFCPRTSKCRAKTHTPPRRRCEDFKQPPRLLACAMSEVQCDAFVMTIIHTRGSFVGKGLNHRPMPWKVAQMMVTRGNLGLRILVSEFQQRRRALLTPYAGQQCHRASARPHSAVPRSLQPGGNFKRLGTAAGAGQSA